MAVARSTVVLLGTSEGSGITIATTANGTSGIIDLFGSNSNVGEINLFLAFTSTVTAGTLDISLQGSAQAAGFIYSNAIPLVGSYSPINGTQKIQVNAPWSRIQVPRFITANILNNATGANATNVYLVAELFLYS